MATAPKSQTAIRPLKIKFFTTGGTIDKVYFDAQSEFAVGSPQVLEVVKEANVRFEYEIESILQKDSLDMTESDRQFIRDRVAADPCALVVVTHGTDTMVETARALSGLPEKTIVLTGSMQPARFRVTDAVFNIGTAIGAVQSLPPGVYIAMNGRILDPQRAVKNRVNNCFEETTAARPSSQLARSDGEDAAKLDSQGKL